MKIKSNGKTDKLQQVEDILLRVAQQSAENETAWKEFRRLHAENEIKWAESQHKWEEARVESQRKWDELRRESRKQWGDLINKLGTFAEDIVAPGLPGIAKRYFGIDPVLRFTVRSSIRHVKTGQTREFDGIVVGETKWLLNETKSNPRPEYVADFIDLLKDINGYFPEYSHLAFIPIFSSMYLDPSLMTHLTRHGIYAAQMRDDVIDLYNFEDMQKSSGQPIHLK